VKGGGFGLSGQHYLVASHAVGDLWILASIVHGENSLLERSLIPYSNESRCQDYGWPLKILVALDAARSC
jgi:hypothetical protein